ncbi:MAG TPA: capsular biosynthesis protein, partial [Deltaproteobacteria bacterium]|nr:capsular biosynthesis protein [Deltaproteobacteria bacterium]
DKADVKVRPVFPKLFLNLIIGSFAGLLIGVFLAFFQEYVQKMKMKEVK